MVGHRRGNAVAQFVQYGDCIGTLLPPSDRAYTAPWRTSNKARGRPLAAFAISDTAYSRIPSGRTRAVSPKLSRSDLVQWIGSYVSCKGTHVLEQTVQVARHIRFIVLRSTTEVVGHRRGNAVAQFVQYGDCIGTLLPPSDRAYTAPWRTSNEAHGRHRAAPAISDTAYSRIPSGRTRAVSPKLSRSDLVQLAKVGSDGCRGCLSSGRSVPQPML